MIMQLPLKAMFLRNAAALLGGGSSAPVNTVAPTLYGAQRADLPILANPGTWTGATSFAYQWLVDGVPVSGATTRQRICGSAERGKAVACDVTATGPGGSTTVRTASMAMTGSVYLDTFAEVLTNTDLTTFVSAAMTEMRRITGGTITTTISSTTKRATSNSAAATTIYIWPSFTGASKTMGETDINDGEYIVGCQDTWDTTARAISGVGCRVPTAAENSGAYTGYFLEWSSAFEWVLRRRDASSVAWSGTTIVSGSQAAATVAATIGASRYYEVRAVTVGATVEVRGWIYESYDVATQRGVNLLLELSGVDNTGGALTASIGCPAWLYGRSSVGKSNLTVRTLGRASVSAENNAAITVLADACWSAFSNDRMIRVGDKTFVGSVTSSLSSMKQSLSVIEKGRITNLQHGFTLGGRNDHREPVFEVLPSGKLLVFGGPHGSDGFYFKSKDTTMKSWDNRTTYHDETSSTTENAYARTWQRHGRLFNFSRLGAGGQSGGNAHVLHSWPIAALENNTNMPQTPVSQWFVTNERPYPRIDDNPANNDIWALTSGALPGEVAAGLPCDLFLLRGQCQSDGTITWYDGNLPNIDNAIGAVPIDIRRDGSRVLDSTTVEDGGQNWPMDIKIFDGVIYATSMRYPNISSSMTNMQHWTHIKRPGEAVVSRLMTRDMPRLTLIALRGSSIDGNDPNLIWACEYDATVGSGRYVMRLYRYDWTTGEKTLLQQWSDAANHFARPYSPKGHDGLVACTAWKSDSHDDFDTYGADTTAVYFSVAA